MFHNVLICTDFTDGLDRLVNFVPSLALSGMRRIVFLHTVPLSENREIPRPDKELVAEARDRLAPALENMPDGVEVEVEVQWARPVEHIAQASETYEADLIIGGIPTRNWLNEKLFGSTMLELCKRLRTPILTLRPELISAYTSEELELRCRHLFRYLLLPYDDSKSARYLLEQVKQLTHDQIAQQTIRVVQRCRLCWVVNDGGLRRLMVDQEMQRAEKRLAEVSQELAADELDIASEVRRGEPVLEVLATAREHDISAIAMSSSTLGKLISWSVPSLAGEILHRSWHPVLYFPPETDC
jgi:nucleotide-binding universal stress UspA family protein